jgi:GNAT superfamily N-acetyltransferase
LTLSDNLIVRDVVASDRAAWELLWEGYNVFYGRVGEKSLKRDITEVTWERLLDPAIPVHGLVAETDGQVVGLTHFLFHHSTTSIAPTCYLNDLFTVENLRGRGIAAALINEVYTRAKAAGSPSVYWLTHETNETARRLYDRISRNSGFLVYRTVL